MSVLDIASAIIDNVEAMPDTCDYVYIGLTFSILLSLVPAFCKLCEVSRGAEIRKEFFLFIINYFQAALNSTNSSEINILDIPVILFEKASFSCITVMKFAFGDQTWEKLVLTIGFMLRFCLTFLYFFLLAVAERTFKQRFATKITQKKNPNFLQSQTFQILIRKTLLTFDIVTASKKI